MSLELPEADRTHLQASPLELVVCQVRFEETLGVADGRIALAIHDDLGGKAGLFQRIEPAKSTQVEILAGSAPVIRSGWRFTSEDQSWIATVMPDAASLETLAYGTWKDFSGPLVQLMQSVQKHVAPALEQRLGLRYVNRLTRPEVEEARGWQGHVAPELLGPILHPLLGPSVLSSQQQIELDVGEGVRCLLRHGALSDPGRAGLYSYVIDIDVFRQGAEPFDSEGIEQAAHGFNDLALRIFHQTVTRELIAMLREPEGATP